MNVLIPHQTLHHAIQTENITLHETILGALSYYGYHIVQGCPAATNQSSKQETHHATLTSQH
jgi:hypothetical protein